MVFEVWRRRADSGAAPGPCGRAAGSRPRSVDPVDVLERVERELERFAAQQQQPVGRRLSDADRAVVSSRVRIGCRRPCCWRTADQARRWGLPDAGSTTGAGCGVVEVHRRHDRELVGGSGSVVGRDGSRRSPAPRQARCPEGCTVGPAPGPQSCGPCSMRSATSATPSAHTASANERPDRARGTARLRGARSLTRARSLGRDQLRRAAPTGRVRTPGSSSAPGGAESSSYRWPVFSSSRSISGLNEAGARRAARRPRRRASPCAGSACRRLLDPVAVCGDVTYAVR